MEYLQINRFVAYKLRSIVWFDVNALENLEFGS